ncbi:hypothetical protein ABZ858_23860 [Streptomyces sp. NPDC047017]|uniref:hypothetical protein n=1 Tax=Streptomyces sp. NPDC047017 TaxID=3155024 RepID=UPI0033FDB22F
MHLTDMNAGPRHAAAATLALLTGVALAACGSAADTMGPETPHFATAQSITRAVVLGPDSRTITTVIAVGGCQEGRLTGSEADSKVTLVLSLITREPAGQVCAADVGLDRVSYRLRTPLGDREVIDKATGKPLEVVDKGVRR